MREPEDGTPDPVVVRSRSDSPTSDRGRRFGRPPLPRDKARSERVVSFVTPGEFQALKELADARGESVSAAVHLILSSALMEDPG